MLTPLFTKILIEPIEKKTEGIGTPNTAKEKSQEGIVIAAGDDVSDVIQEKDVVVFKKFSSTEVDGGLIIDEEDVLCIRE